jgi:hypothetical protein
MKIYLIFFYLKKDPEKINIINFSISTISLFFLLNIKISLIFFQFILKNFFIYKKINKKK